MSCQVCHSGFEEFAITLISMIASKVFRFLVDVSFHLQLVEKAGTMTGSKKNASCCWCLEIYVWEVE